jgi:hypothetical protein
MAETEFKIAVKQMRAAMQSAIASAVGTFQQQTGVTPSGIHVDLVEVTSGGDSARVFVVGSVRFKFDDQ